MQPRSYDGDMRPAKQPDKCGNPCRVDNIRSSPVLAELSFMGMCSMISSSFNCQQSLTCLLVCTICIFLHSEKSCRII
jgi:hypothetical protein